jgi:hypothetical protein
MWLVSSKESGEEMKKHDSKRKKCKATHRRTFGKQLRLRNHKRAGSGINGRAQPKNEPDDAWIEMRKRQEMQLKLEDERLVIILPRIDPPAPSRSRKSYLIATTGGVKQTRLLVEGVPVHVVATAFTYGDWVPPAKWMPLLELPEDYYSPYLKNDQDEDTDEMDEVEELH